MGTVKFFKDPKNQYWLYERGKYGGKGTFQELINKHG